MTAGASGPTWQYLHNAGRAHLQGTPADMAPVYNDGFTYPRQPPTTPITQEALDNCGTKECS